MSRRDAFILRAAAVWTLWVWGTRIGNVIGDDARSTAFKAVHVVLALVSVAFAVALLRVASRNRRKAEAAS
jgi:predicted branched-subunit amino acid permease